jgi:hypothetical protein
MSSIERRAAALLSLLLSALLAARAAAQEKGPPFPDAGVLFPRLLADPRQAQTTADYYRLAGEDMADVALGDTWGLRRWYFGESGDTAVQSDVEGMGYSQFKLSRGVNELETIDFFANLPVEIRRGPLSGRFTLYHESSHLGDDYIRATGDTGSRYSAEGVSEIASVDLGRFLRVYGGGSYLFHRVPDIPGGTVQGGFELVSSDLRGLPPHARLYLAEDLQSKEYVGWNLNSSTEAGVRLGYDGVRRQLRLHVGHFQGHSPFGQFRDERVSYNSLGASFDF